MTDTPASAPVKAKDSASVLIIRDGAVHDRYGALQILMVKRHQKIRFAGGAYVFPGGKLDPADRALEEQDQKDAAADISAEFRGLRYAALREVFEETGLVIGTQAGQAINEAGRAALDRDYRQAFLDGSLTLADFLAQSGVTLDMGDCYPFAHWITPEVYPVRFDTRFYLTVAPAGQMPSPDGHEITEVQWMYPMKLVEESDGVLMFPTMMNLKMLGQARSVAEALDLLGQREIVTVTPEVIEGDKVSFRKIPAAAGYEDVDQTRTRTAIDLKNG
ncbi:NUDIX hydrolase [Paremcibacter congregatus]|uniref:NUDIX hydrolase n=1 Tax=Paremcibacter congregatus TaxID=2043170 RepID=UPI003A94F396